MIRIIPAIDIIDGRCVRLAQGDYNIAKCYFDDPVDAAAIFADAGFEQLHVVDLDGAKSSCPKNLNAVERMANSTSLKIEYGGGIKSLESLESVFGAGVAKAICGSVAVREPQTVIGWLDRFGAERIVLGADIRDGVVAVNGWTEQSDRSITELIDRFAVHNLRQVICTDISRDGMLCGPNFELYKELQQLYPAIEITVSGGIGSVDDIVKLDRLKLRSVVVGRAIYENRITIDCLKTLCSQNE